MSFLSRPALALTAAMIGVAALLGGSLGIVAAAHNQSLVQGFNLVGGPLGADTAPGHYISCVPTSAWTAIYIWDAQNQKWQHYFNTDDAPTYINNPDAGGIQTIKRLAGVVVLTTQAVPDATFLDRPSDQC
ncbi:MAG: hypothetical protein WD557_00290 [Dehalococcoidia bacterium]